MYIIKDGYITHICFMYVIEHIIGDTIGHIHIYTHSK